MLQINQHLFSLLAALSGLSTGCVCIDANASLTIKGQLVDRFSQPLANVPITITLYTRGAVVHPSPIQAYSNTEGTFEADRVYAGYPGTVPFFCLWLPLRAPAPQKFDSIRVTAEVPSQSCQDLIKFEPDMLVRTDQGAVLDLGTVTLPKAADLQGAPTPAATIVPVRAMGMASGGG